MEFSPLFSAAVGAVLGGLMTWLVLALRAKIAKFQWWVKVDRIALSADDPVFGSVRVHWGGSEVQNLYLATLMVENTSEKDFENVSLTIYPDMGTKLLNERTAIVDTPKIVKWSLEFDQKLQVQRGEEATSDQFDLYFTRREYLVPVINRGQSLQFQYLCTRPQDNLLPNVFVDVSTKGVKLVPQKAHRDFILKVPIGRAFWLGIPTTILIVFSATAYLENIWFVAVVSFLLGGCAAHIGALIGAAWWGLWARLFD